MPTVAYNYSDIFLIPNHGILTSRNLANTSAKLGNFTFKLPVVPANMKTIVDIDTCKYLSTQGMFYVMHRFDVDNEQFCGEMWDSGHYASISLGVGDKDIEFVNRMHKFSCYDPEFITIDIAHGDSVMMLDMIKYVKEKLPNSFLIAGNVATVDGVKRLENAGADAIKLGIGPGQACETYKATGFTYPQFSAVLEASSEATKPIIADGGIRSVGDISKALVAGADFVMAGGLFSGYDQNPKTSRQNDGKFLYYGSASAENKGKHEYVEGRVLSIDYRGNMDDLIYDISAGLKSAISYSGGTDIATMKVKTKWGVVYK